VGPGELWERIPADPGMDFYLKIPAGKDPGNLRVHLCPALESIRPSIPHIIGLLSHSNQDACRTGLNALSKLSDYRKISIFLI
jgi:hypothetical protein